MQNRMFRIMFDLFSYNVIKTLKRKHRSKDYSFNQNWHSKKLLIKYLRPILRDFISCLAKRLP